MVVAPMKDRFNPSPSSTSAIQKCATVMPEIPTTAAAAINARPMHVMRSTPRRAMKAPVTKLGAYIATMASAPFPPTRSMIYLPSSIRDNSRDNGALGPEVGDHFGDHLAQAMCLGC